MCNATTATATATTKTKTKKNLVVVAVVPDEQLDGLQKLQKYCPGATQAERKRFLTAKDGDYDLALEQLKVYLNWRDEYDLDHSYHHSCSFKNISSTTTSTTTSTSTSTSARLDEKAEDKVDEDEDVWHCCASNDQTLDELDWRFASQKALSYDKNHVSNQSSTTTSTSATATTLPQLARIITITEYEYGSEYNNNDHNDHNHSCDLDGNRILQLLPAQMDLSVASDSTFALCIALYLERKLSRDSMEKMTVVIDVRGGQGWANPTPKQLIPFIKKVSSYLEQNFPERLSKSVLFPMPFAATMLWNCIKVFLDPTTAEKIALVRGNANTNATPPYKLMEKHMERGIIDRMETIRCATFVVTNNN